MNTLSNRARVHTLALAYVNDIAISQAQTVPNLTVLQVIAEAFISSVGIDLAEQYLDIDNATGVRLNDIAKIVGVNRSDLQGTTQYNNDDFFRTYIRFAIVRNFSRASLSSLSSMLFVLFGNEVYLARQQTPFSIGIFASDTHYETIKILLEKNLISLALCHNATILVKEPPLGYKWWGIFTIPYSLVIDGKMTELEYNEYLAEQKQTHWQPKDGGTKYIYITEEFIYRP